MPYTLPVYIGNETIAKFIEFCQQRQFQKFLLVCDQNTYPVLGKAVEEALQAQGWNVVTACLKGKEIIADEHYLIQVLMKADREERIFLAVGSGTLTDLSRFTSFKTKTSFISLPTAASVDGFTSIGAPLVIDGVKKTYISQPPIAVFADVPTLCHAPRLLSAAGYGDLIGKLLSSADWKLGHILWDEKYDPDIDRVLRASALQCADSAQAIRQGLEEGILPLMHGLIDSGFCMLNFGNSNPASGAEHHISHFWELQLLNEHRPAIFHGVKVGVASILTSAWYEKIRGISQEEVKNILKNASFGQPEEQIRQIQAAFGSIADEIIAEQKAFIYMSESELEGLKQRIVERWPEVQEIAAQTPGPGQLKAWLQAAGAPVTGQELGFSEEMVRKGLDHGHFLRRRFTINKLRVLLGLPAM
jgi:glycerol-1-phosphate dehydrogenase [NAD(P)+]